MKKIKINNLTVFIPDNNSKDEQILQAREKFVQKYCVEKGWPTDIDKLSLTQIFEIREQEGWKNPFKK